MHTYHIAPIDFGWESLQTVAAIAGKLGALKAEFAVHRVANPDLHIDVDDFLADWERAKDKAGAAGWEGDFRNDPVVFWVPFSDGFRYGFAFKQENNGSTFVVSPVPMPWLD